MGKLKEQENFSTLLPFYKELENFHHTKNQKENQKKRKEKTLWNCPSCNLLKFANILNNLINLVGSSTPDSSS